LKNEVSKTVSKERKNQNIGFVHSARTSVVFWPVIRIILYHCRKMRLQMKAQKPIKRIFPPLNKINKNTWAKATG